MQNALVVGATNLLFSYLHSADELLDLLETKKPKYPDIYTFVDSGAFSVLMSKGRQQIDIPAYCHFLRQNLHRIDIYANADDISSPENSLRAQKIIESEGLHPIPVYHLAEPRKYLQDYAERYEYIAIGGYAGSSDYKSMSGSFALAVKFARQVHPGIKIHGFGIGAIPVITSLPWASVDSTRWLVSTQNGMLDLWDRGRIVSVPISEMSPSRRKSGHFDNLTPVEQNYLLDKWQEIAASWGEDGVTSERLRADRMLRSRLNLYVWTQVQKACEGKTFESLQTEVRLFD